MRYRLAKVAVLAVLMIPASAAASAAHAAAAAAGPARTAAAVSPAAVPSDTVLLVNGAVLTVRGRRGGTRPGTVATAGSGLPGSVLTLGMGRRSYEIPAAALPYLGRGLDPSLFDVSLLSARESGGHVPVRIAYRGRRPSLPGVVITSATGGVAEGYLTGTSARKFGAALVRQFLADHARGSYGQDGLFGAGVRVSLAGVTAPRVASAEPQARPGFALHTLTVTGINLAGKADTGDSVIVFNVDNTVLFGDGFENVNVFYRGRAKFSLPAGRYWAVGDFIDTSRPRRPVGERLVVLPQFTVSGDRSVRVPEQSANSKIMMVTPRPSVPLATGFELRRLSRVGQIMYGYWLEKGAFPLWVSPTTRRPTVGKLQAYTDQWRTSPHQSAAPYEYDLADAAHGTIPPQQRTVNQRGLATVHARYYSDVRSDGQRSSFGLFPPQLNDQLMFGWSSPVDMPASQTRYVTGNPAIAWSNGMAQYGTGGNNGEISGDQSGWAVYRAGERVNESWDAYPLHTQTGGSLPFVTPAAMPGASRDGDVLRLHVTPFSDSNGHRGEGFSNGDNAPVIGSYQIDENGKKIAAGRSNDVVGGIPYWGIGFWQVKLDPKPSLIKFTVDAARTRSRYPLSSSIHTEWTWRSAYRTGGTLPAGWTCTVVFPPDRHCSPEPMMTLDYHVARLTLNESAPPGAQVLDVTAGHAQFARHPRVTSATVQVSFNDGKTWRHALVTSLGRGQFRAAYTAPASSFVTLRVSASDAAQGRISETITRAYRIASH